jgi:hypothetical protein
MHTILVVAVTAEADENTRWPTFTTMARFTQQSCNAPFFLLCIISKNRFLVVGHYYYYYYYLLASRKRRSSKVQ